MTVELRNKEGGPSVLSTGCQKWITEKEFRKQVNEFHTNIHGVKTAHHRAYTKALQMLKAAFNSL